jgi:hypothetical protein
MFSGCGLKNLPPDIESAVKEPPTRADPVAWGLDVGLTTLHRKIIRVMKHSVRSWGLADSCNV